jgi:hypothetical protein
MRLFFGRSIPAIRATIFLLAKKQLARQSLSLTLFVLGVFTNDPYNAFSLDDLTLVANFPY